MTHNTREPFPDVPSELLEELAARFPDKLPSGPVTETELARLVGQQTVLRFLRSQAAAQAARQTGGTRQ
jgi:hypothetical protein